MAFRGDFRAPRLSCVLTPRAVEERLLNSGMGKEDADGEA